ncbi:hypothetical protein M885DRAFT_617528 [Pelagophyceae sp. CCMP2097]|nr:hypothetical protein M885DRAFT_617528 [Pelagophyceae sp. CCMP2097]
MSHVDLRDEFARTLWDAASSLRSAAHEDHRRRALVTALVNIAVEDRPLMNVSQAQRCHGVGDAVAVVLRAGGEKGEERATQRGRFASAAIALLSALVDLEGSCEQGLVPMDRLLASAALKLEEGRSFRPLAEIAQHPGCCVAWAQLAPLETRKWVKRRQRKASAGGHVFELTEEGRWKARDLAEERIGNGGHRRGPLHEWAGGGDASVVLVVDTRERGGDARGGLEGLSKFLKDEAVPFRAQTLRTGLGDYVFQKAGGAGVDETLLCPIIIERKEICDLAESMRDGRWDAQHAAMRQTKASWDLRNDAPTRIIYIVEGDARRFVHTACGCGCRGVGRCRNPTVDQVEAAVSARASTCEIRRTKDLRDTVRQLALMYRECRKREEPTAPLTPTRRRRAASDDEDFFHDAPPPPEASPKKKRAADAGAVPRDHARLWLARDSARLAKLSGAQLKALCAATGEAVAGTKPELVARLVAGEVPQPWLLARRKARAPRGDDRAYVPADRTCGMALLCAMERFERRSRPGAVKAGATSEELMREAEQCGIAKVSLYDKGGTDYDGWSVVNSKFCKTQPPIAQCVKGRKYILTEAADDADSGLGLATALHAKAHDRGWCACGDAPPTSEWTRPTGLGDICGPEAPAGAQPADIRSYFSPAAAPPEAARPRTPATAPKTASKQRPPSQRPPMGSKVLAFDDSDDDFLDYDPYAGGPTQSNKAANQPHARPPSPARQPQERPPPRADDETDAYDSDGSASVMDLTSPPPARRANDDVVDLT